MLDGHDTRRAGRPALPEWPLTLDLAALVDRGWRPTPFRQFILKIHSRCDLACTYCYMYEMADQSWRSRPPRMAPDVVEAVAARIAEHVRAHRLPSVELILHGGEPLLVSPEGIDGLVRTVRDAVDAPVAVTVQTNGVRLDRAYLGVFDRLDVGVGVSLDGDQRAHDRSRRTAGGHGSHHKVAAGLRLLGEPPFDRLFRGLLCTVDLRNDPLETYQALLSFGPPTIDFLLPHGTWAQPPPGLGGEGGGTPYADWLITIFDDWYAAPARPAGVRLFEEIIFLLLGGGSASEQIGLSPTAMVVVETDGEIEQSDILKSAFAGAPGTGYHVLRDSFDEVLALPSIAARQIGWDALSPTCRACPVARVCGGGHYAHRYRPGSGFLNPSVYCADLLRLITHVASTIKRDITALQKDSR
ncbi:FxsB family cyclophane-forming radical SAM/SPASM peptide maturase [Nonomuraea gerenzanensis]|uniref:ATP-dependent DNA helicase RecQ n=1 Tax=Nonomuraea gerenzanensis TaxID=93944 RepID=A0A1M4DXM3_9ACTN|nr:FxsB family cyclophane-forming radical SAM/SPASM peptide maturase [Nonomuraea gerenzanensis]UBU13643.1 FxsB family radical SAM/SPASM domain protein [Nonomuraea gerenzanensis]SBO91309.1 ATP-dependent DNA helicase RecQ [Nonomuraea gerenzanensis]